MTGINLTSRTRQAVRSLLVPASLLALGIVPVVAGLVRLAGLMTGQAGADDERFFEKPLPVTLHILAVIPYSLLGAPQFAPALRRRAWHRAVGMALVPLGLLAALTGLWMAHDGAGLDHQRRPGGMRHPYTVRHSPRRQIAAGTPAAAVHHLKERDS